MSTVGLIALSGSSEFLKVVLSSAKVSNSLLTENDFKQTITKGLTIDCQKTLLDRPKTDRIIKEGNLDETDKSNNIIEFTGSLPGGIQAGQDFKDSIKVIKIELRGDYTDATNTESNFVVYYKKLNLGKAGARDSQNCIAKTATATAKVTGCFYHTCQVKYDQGDKVCRAVDDCHIFSEHKEGQIREISKAEITATIRTKDCADGEFLKGFKEDGSPDCSAPQAPATLPAVNCPNDGEFLKGFNKEGEPDCQSPCYGGQIYYESIDFQEDVFDDDFNTVTVRSTVKYPVGSDSSHVFGKIQGSEKRFCECPPNKPHWNDTECIKCIDGRQWVKAEKACMSCTGGIWVTSSGDFQCECPIGKIKKKVG